MKALLVNFCVRTRGLAVVLCRPGRAGAFRGSLRRQPLLGHRCAAHTYPEPLRNPIAAESRLLQGVAGQAVSGYGATGAPPIGSRGRAYWRRA